MPVHSDGRYNTTENPKKDATTYLSQTLICRKPCRTFAFQVKRIVKTMPEVLLTKAGSIGRQISGVGAKRGKIPTLSLRAPAHLAHPPNPPQPLVLFLSFGLHVFF